MLAVSGRIFCGVFTDYLNNQMSAPEGWTDDPVPEEEEDDDDDCRPMDLLRMPLEDLPEQ